LRLDLHSWSRNLARARRFVTNDRVLTSFDSLPSILKATSPTAPPVALSSRSARPNTSSSSSSAAPASTARPAALSSQRHSSGCWRTLSAASSPLHGHSSATREALTGIVAQAQAITKNINPQGRAATDVNQALPGLKSAAATSVATLFKRFDKAVFFASWDFVTVHPVRDLSLSSDVCAPSVPTSPPCLLTCGEHWHERNMQD
jgi:hypothetical protein